MYLYCNNVTGGPVLSIDETIGVLQSIPFPVLSLGEQVSELVDGELVKLGGVLDDTENLLLGSFVEVRFDVTIRKRIRMNSLVSRGRVNLTS